MILVSWNCRGLGNPQAVCALHLMVKMKGPQVLFLMETKLDAVRMEMIRIHLGFGNNFTMPSLGSSGGLAFIWNEEAMVSVWNYSQYHIDADIGMITTKNWLFTGFYGHPDHGHRRESWALLKHLGRLDSKPWLCMGGFNEILTLIEKTKGRARPMRQILDFHEAVNTCQLIELGYEGEKFTWNNNRDYGKNVQGRLDHRA